MLPELTNVWRQDRLQNMNHIAHELFRLWTESEIDASLGAEHVRHHGITAALHARTSKPALRDHAAMDLCQLEVRINLGFDGDDFVFSVE